VSLTGSGDEFLGRARRILLDYAAATGALADLQAEPTGRLKISVGVSFALRQLGAVVSEFMTSHPQVIVELFLNDRFVDPVEEGFDLCVRIGALGDSSLVARRLATVHRLICAAPAYLARHGTPLTPADLERHRGLHYSHLGPAPRWHLQGPEGHATVEPSSALCANNGDVLLEAAIAGHGVVSLPTFILGDAVREGRLVVLLPRWRQQPRGLQRRLLRHALQRLLGDVVDVPANPIEDALELVRSGHRGQTYHLPYGVELQITDGTTFRLCRYGHAQARQHTRALQLQSQA